MYLELLISKGEGYVSTFSDDGFSLSCKPTAKHVINDMLDEYKQKSDLYRVDSFGSSNGDERHVIKEKVSINFKSETTKSEVEFSRYKQDCRKRAIDIAQYRLSELVKYESIDFDLKDNKGKLIPKSVTQDTLLIAMADKYYNWLISIPNE